METQIDIQMPVRKGGFIVGEVIQRLLMQDAPFTFYVDAGKDLEMTSDHECLIALIATSPENADRITKSTKVAFKRNRMTDRLRTHGRSPYVYLADPDVLLPERPFFSSTIRAFERNPKLGAVGLCYQDSDHVACGSMMLRREDFLQIGKLQGTGRTCVCGNIQIKLHESNLQVVPLKTLRAVHLKSQYREGYPEYEAVECKVSADGILQRSFLEKTIDKYGTRFRLFIQDDNTKVSRAKSKKVRKARKRREGSKE